LLVLVAHIVGIGLKETDRGATFPAALGILGVVIFFVHTSLVLLLSLERLPVAGWRAAVSFYLRRLFRLYPLSVLTVLTVLVLRIPADPFLPFQSLSVQEIIANLALIQNITGSRNATVPLWSLPWEVQMYAVLPLVFFAVRSRRLAILAFVVGIAVAANIVGVWNGYRYTRALQYVPCFMAVSMAYVHLSRVRLRLPAIAWPLVLMVVAFVYGASGVGWPLHPIRYPEWCTCALLGFLIPRFHDMEDNLLSRAAKHVSTYSYGIYLFHMPSMWVGFTVLSAYGPIVAVVVTLVMTGLLSVTMYHLVEQPMINMGKRVAVRFERFTYEENRA